MESTNSTDDHYLTTYQLEWIVKQVIKCYNQWQEIVPEAVSGKYQWHNHFCRCSDRQASCVCYDFRMHSECSMQWTESTDKAT